MFELIPQYFNHLIITILQWKNIKLLIANLVLFSMYIIIG